MHPTVRVVLFLVLAVFLASADPGVTIAATAALASAYLVLRPPLGALLAMLARLRYLWLSLAVLYFWFTPGAPLWPELGAGSPTAEGLRRGGLRIAALGLMTGAAYLLVQSAARAELIVAVEALLRPFARFGLDGERFALRLVLVLETVPRLARGGPPAPAAGRGVGALIARLEARFSQAMLRAEREPTTAIAIPALGAPPLWQWLWPGALAAILAGAALLV